MNLFIISSGFLPFFSVGVSFNDSYSYTYICFYILFANLSDGKNVREKWNTHICTNKQMESLHFVLHLGNKESYAFPLILSGKRLIEVEAQVNVCVPCSRWWAHLKGPQSRPCLERGKRLLMDTLNPMFFTDSSISTLL